MTCTIDLVYAYFPPLTERRTLKAGYLWSGESKYRGKTLCGTGEKSRFRALSKGWVSALSCMAWPVG
jgi:hypothetical protein